MEEFREGRGQVEHGTVNVELMKIARDGARQQALINGLFGHGEREAAGPVADVKMHAAADGGEHLGKHPSLLVKNSALASVEGVGDDVACAQDGKEILERR